MAKQAVFFSIVLVMGLLLGMFVVGPSFRSEQPSTTNSAEHFVGAGKDVSYNDVLQALEKRQSQEARKRYRLQEKVDQLERQVLKLQLIVASLSDDEDSEINEELATEEEEEQVAENDENEMDREAQLVAAGLDPQQAKNVMRFLGEIEMERLYLQDQATREGWMGTSRYRKEFMALRQREKNIRQELGEDEYDKYLFGSRQKNRVAIQSLIEGSPAQDVGIQVGDIVYSYAGKRLFMINDLKNATTEGTGGELVPIQIVRDGDTMDFYIPRGPLGVRLKSDRVRP